jgi:flagellar assembly protein FliH
MSEGVKRGAAQQRQELAKHANALAELIEALAREKKEFFARMEDEALNLAFAIAEKILNHRIETDRDAICHVLAGALHKIVDHDGIRIHVHPDDYRHLTAGKVGVFPGLEGVKEAMLVADAAVGRGGAVIESAFGEVDARLDQQLNELKSAVSGR